MAQSTANKACDKAADSKEEAQQGKERSAGIMQQIGEQVMNMAQGAIDRVKNTLGINETTRVKKWHDPGIWRGTQSIVEGVECITASALHYVALAGPTLYGQVVNTAAEIASCSISYNSSKLIITDGVVTGLQETKDALVRASDLPFPVPIGGVGGADFKQMEER